LKTKQTTVKKTKKSTKLQKKNKVAPSKKTKSLKDAMTQIFMGNSQQQKTTVVEEKELSKSTTHHQDGNFRRWQPGERVQTAPSVAVKNLVYFGTVVCHPENSNFVRILWDDGSNQCHHYSSVVVCSKKRGAASKQVQQTSSIQDFQELINQTINQ
jgi:hypothetical protein